MITLSCRHLAQDCLDKLSAADSQEIQKVFLDHVHAKHAQQWSQYSQQFRVVSLVAMRNRFRAQMAEDLHESGIPGAAS